ncbi:hypothetical protein AVEN_259858-1 [Araneus ventricosus]|uniref:Uncharacterized protein n=1 Tax=Araneus ventricosus TaxID=182803 RepID=A0A4Y2DT13_ARAVE|nr:hypothetical protein AVEN_259858-1 [Araneus ventricosus]
MECRGGKVSGPEGLQVRNPIPLHICRVWRLWHVKTYVVDTSSRWCGAEVWSIGDPHRLTAVQKVHAAAAEGRLENECCLECHPYHLAKVQNCEVRPNIAFVWLRNGMLI